MRFNRGQVRVGIVTAVPRFGVLTPLPPLDDATEVPIDPGADAQLNLVEE